MAGVRRAEVKMGLDRVGDRVAQRRGAKRPDPTPAQVQAFLHALPPLAVRIRAARRAVWACVHWSGGEHRAAAL